jgi:hypothetical protein
MMLNGRTGGSVNGKVSRLVMSHSEFCRSAGISRRLLNSLLEQKQGPATIRIGRRRVILRTAAERWLRELEDAA